VGKNGPIGMELYFRSGVAFPTGGGIGNLLDVGWSIGGGGRTLFFNPEETRAWTVDLGVMNIHNESADFQRSFTYNIVPPAGQTTPTSATISVRNMDETLVSLSAGREWYLLGSANLWSDHVCWRAGFDGGGRYGTAKMNVNGLTHITDTIGGMFVAVHSDVELPWGNCMFLFGVRGEYSYVWTDILQSQNPTDVQQFTILFNAGLRF
jgi:hypothetical protein